jgi:hypothetical protein
LAFWFRRQYSLAPTDPRFLDATIEDIETDYWAHYYANNPAKEELEDDDFDLEAELRDAEQQSGGDDPDDWETVIEQ